MLAPPTGSAYSISVPNTGLIDIYCVASSYKAGTGKTSAFDVKNSGTGATLNPSNAVTTTVNGDVIVQVLGDGTNTAPTAYSHTLLYSTDDGLYSDNHQYALQASLGLITLSWTVAADDWGIITGAWKEIAPPVYLAGVVTGIGTTAGFTKILHTLKSLSQGQAGVTGFAKVLKTFAGTVSGTSTISGFAKIIKKLEASVSGTSSVVSSLTVVVIKYLAGIIQGLSTVSGFVKIAHSLASVVNGVASSTGAIHIFRGLKGTSNGVVSVSAFARITHTLKGSINGIASSTGVIHIFRGLKGVSNGVASITGMIGRLYSLSGQIIGNSIVNGFVSINCYLKTISNGIASVSGTLGISIEGVWLSAVVAGTSIISGFLNSLKSSSQKIIIKIVVKEPRLSSVLEDQTHHKITVKEHRYD
jgi:hypothetical protein